MRKARHIEVQVLLGDRGTGLGFVERECSVQRRHQKLVEETPSPAVGPSLRKRLIDVAVRGLRAVGYRNAGTMEFLFHEGRFTFNEVNARLQVEHPITEMVTGVDLVRQQFRIAAGEAIEVSSNEVRRRGHAIECRLNAEDPLRQFLPSPGLADVRLFEIGVVFTGWDEGADLPHESERVAMVLCGDAGEPHWSQKRRSVDAFEVRGIPTNLPFHRSLLSERHFRRGELWTTMVADLRIAERLRTRGPWEERVAALAAALVESGRLASGPTYALEKPQPSAWSLAGRKERFAGGAHAVPARRRW